MHVCVCDRKRDEVVQAAGVESREVPFASEISDGSCAHTSDRQFHSGAGENHR